MIHVIKISGHELEHRAQLVHLIRVLYDHPGQIVLVHAGGSQLSQALARIGGGQSGDVVRDTAAMALRGAINPQLVATLVGQGIQAIGLCGADLELLCVQQSDAPPIVRFEVLHYLLQQNWVPVLAPLALNLATGRCMVLNADAAAQIIASALGADELTYVVDTPGVFSAGQRITGIAARQAETYVRQKVIDPAYASVVRAAAAAAPHVGIVRITNLRNLDTGVETLVVD